MDIIQGLRTLHRFSAKAAALPKLRSAYGTGPSIVSMSDMRRVAEGASVTMAHGSNEIVERKRGKDRPVWSLRLLKSITRPIGFN